MTNSELLEEYESLKAMLANINSAITGLLTKNKKYTYSNVEATHMAETQSLSDLRLLRKDIKIEITAILNQLNGPFVKLKNYN